MAFRVPVTSYTLAVSRDNPATFLIDGTWNTVDWAARIVCFGELDRKPWQGFLFFARQGEEPIPNFRSETTSGVIRAFLFLTREQYEWCVDILRNESPVFLVWSDEDPDASYLTTEKEAVGEGELTGTGDPGDRRPGTGRPDAALPDRSYAPFEETSLAHSLVNGYLLAHAARDVYGDGLANNTGSVFLDWFRERFTPWMTVTAGVEPKFDFISDTALLAGTGVQCMVMSNDRFVIVTFRGTQWVGDDPTDWATNAGFLGAPVPPNWALPGVVIHGGWLSAVEKIYPELLDLIAQHRKSNQPLWITGHSLGGSLALVAAFKLHSMGDAVVQGVNTYGCPPVGGGRFHSAYATQDLQRRTRRWVNNRDIGPQIPLPGYSAVGLKTFIDADGNIEPDAPAASFAFPSFSDHSIVAYCDLIRAKLAPEDAAAVPL